MRRKKKMKRGGEGRGDEDGKEEKREGKEKKRGGKEEKREIREEEEKRKRR